MTIDEISILADQVVNETRKLNQAKEIVDQLRKVETRLERIQKRSKKTRVAIADMVNGGTLLAGWDWTPEEETILAQTVFSILHSRKLRLQARLADL